MSETFQPGTEVRADAALGGYSGIVTLPHGTFDGIEGIAWRTCTQIEVTDPAASRWDAGQLVNVETDCLSRRSP